MNVYYLLLFLLGICFCFYYKYKIVIEGLQCDPDKPKVYPERNGKRFGEKGYKPSERECQEYNESEGSSNLDDFDAQLREIRKQVNKSKSDIDTQNRQHNENVDNTEKLIDSLNCKRDSPKKGDIDCSETAEDDDNNNDEGEGQEVDLSGSSRNARNDAAKAERPTFKF